MSWSDDHLLACFRMPSGLTITGRNTSIRNTYLNIVKDGSIFSARNQSD